MQHPLLRASVELHMDLPMGATTIVRGAGGHLQHPPPMVASVEPPHWATEHVKGFWITTCSTPF
eukprot:3832012-Pyramimonas_sp.AAC.1